jgi:hypothetical protein
MITKRSLLTGLISVFLSVNLASAQVSLAQAPEASETTDWMEVTISEFVPSPGDYVMADTSASIGFLMNDTTKKHAIFPIISGRKKWVTYIGRRYFAETPARTWFVKDMDIKGDRVTFSKSGKFLRLYADGKPTAYGIHGYKYFQNAIEKDQRYISFGCVLVEDEVLEVIQKSFEANDNELKVVTYQ